MANILPPLKPKIEASWRIVSPRWCALGRGLVAVLSSCCLLVAAQDSNLATQRAKFESDLLGSTLPVLKQHVAELAALEKKAAAVRDYDAAIAIRTERERVEAEISSQAKVLLMLEARQQSVTSKTPDRTLLKPSEAKLEGVRYDPSAGVLTDWTAPGATAIWRLPDLPPGGYEVVLRYSSGPFGGGSVRVQEAFYSLAGELKTTSKGHEELNLGTLRVRDGGGVFRVTALTVSKGNAMQLHSVELLPSNR